MNFTRSILRLLTIITILTIAGVLCRPAEAQIPVIYAALGPEASSILRQLIDPADFIQVQPGTLASVLAQHHIDRLLLPKDWSVVSDLDAAQRAGLPITYLKRHLTIADITDNITLVAAITNQQERGQVWNAQIQLGVTKVQKQLQGLATTRVLVLSPEAYTQGQGTLITEMIQVAGGINVAAEAGLPEARQVSDQQIHDFAPEVVILLGRGWTRLQIQAFIANPLYRGIPAFDNLRLRALDTIGKDPQLLIQDLEMLSAILHPRVF